MTKADLLFGKNYPNKNYWENGRDNLIGSSKVISF